MKPVSSSTTVYLYDKPVYVQKGDKYRLKVEATEQGFIIVNQKFDDNNWEWVDCPDTWMDIGDE